MSWVRIWTHIVFTTKDRKPWLTDEIRRDLFAHIIANAKQKELKLAIVNGYLDHVHLLLALNRDMSLAKALQLIKGESAFWLNKQNVLPQKFVWQDDYWAVGVSESHYQKVFNYIANQEEHHTKTSFQAELNAFLGKYD
jgi:REP element-mobilizing transposase RayT